MNSLFLINIITTIFLLPTYLFCFEDLKLELVAEEVLDIDEKVKLEYHLDEDLNLYISLLLNDNTIDITVIETGDTSSISPINEVKLHKSGSCWIQQINHFGSTFGAYKHIIICNDNEYGWSIIKTPFVRGELVDVNDDGIFEFIDDFKNDDKVYQYNLSGFTLME